MSKRRSDSNTKITLTKMTGTRTDKHGRHEHTTDKHVPDKVRQTEGQTDKRYRERGKGGEGKGEISTGE